jgi:hypothetical protein
LITLFRFDAEAFCLVCPLVAAIAENKKIRQKKKVDAFFIAFSGRAKVPFILTQGKSRAKKDARQLEKIELPGAIGKDAIKPLKVRIPHL